MHVFLVIAAGLALHSDLSNEQIDESWYDWGLFVSFLVLVPGAFCVTVVSKLQQSARQSLSEDSLKMPLVPYGLFRLARALHYGAV